MSLEELMAVVRPPPKRPAVRGVQKWNRLEEKLDIRLPDDYRDMALRYGSGRFVEGKRSNLTIFFPFDADYDSFLTMEHRRMIERRRLEMEGLLPVCPEKYGFLIWGWEDNGYLFGWIAKGTPPKWPILVRDPDGYIMEFKMPMTTLLTKMFTLQVFVPHKESPFFTDSKRVRFSPRKPQTNAFGPSSLF